MIYVLFTKGKQNQVCINSFYIKLKEDIILINNGYNYKIG